jgi:16S rRNA (guanine527-N7)-methyltransferase
MFHVKQQDCLMNESKMVSLAESAKRYYEPKELERFGMVIDPDQRNLILVYLGMVLKDNKAAGLVPEAEVEQIFLRHFCDSLQSLLLFGYKKHARILDIGSSGGFPAIPIRIFRPDLSFVLVEPVRKKATFLEKVKANLSFDNVEVYHGKVEDIDFCANQKADYVISRGGGTLQKFAQLAKPLLADGGHMYTYKTRQFPAELEIITANKDKDGVQISEIAQYDLGGAIQGLSLVSLEVV